MRQIVQYVRGWRWPVDLHLPIYGTEPWEPVMAYRYDHEGD